MTGGRKPDLVRTAAALLPESRGREAWVWPVHLRTVVSLCWRLGRRRWERQGSLMRDLASLAAFLAVVAGCLSFVLALALGWAHLPQAGHGTALLAWGGLIAAFVFVRLFGVFGSLQQGEGLPLDNLLHLPFSLHQVFVLNFVFSQLNLTTIIFVPAFLGLAIACTVALDARNFVLIPASLSLFVCVAAVTHLVQEWITSAMGTRRRRFLIGSLVCTLLMFAMQVSYILYLTQRSESETEVTEAVVTSSEPGYEGVPFGEAGPVTAQEWDLSSHWLMRGWVAPGSSDGRDVFPWLSVVGMAGFVVLAVLCLRGGYRGTLDRYRNGQTTSTGLRARVSQQGKRIPPRARVSPVMAIARITIKHWLRSVHTLINGLPALAVLVLFGFVWLGGTDKPDPYTLLITVIVFMSVFCAPTKLACNLFGLDGRGFRVYRFAGVSARTLLLGKYLALLPVFILLAGAVLTVSAVIGSMLPTHILGTVLQGGIVFLACCGIGGAFSMGSPHAVSPTSTTHRAGCATALLLALAKLVVTALLLLIAWPAIVAEQSFSGDGHVFPVYLMVSMIEFALAVVAFRVFLGRQARELDGRADQILEAVSVTE
ncbi:MAG: hypothetical protein OXI90_08270 [Gammaproteobacteria bacterium]|nr:hypothetical protein [Gammaproteobacteria bacterium]